MNEYSNVTYHNILVTLIERICWRISMIKNIDYSGVDYYDCQPEGCIIRQHMQQIDTGILTSHQVSNDQNILRIHWRTNWSSIKIILIIFGIGYSMP